jgi:hypothetical protein
LCLIQKFKEEKLIKLLQKLPDLDELIMTWDK